MSTFWVWDSTYILFGDQNDRIRVNQYVILASDEIHNNVRGFDDGGNQKVNFRLVPLGDKNARYMFFDLIQPLRAIYFPMAHNHGPHICTYLMVHYRLRKGAQVRMPAGNRIVDMLLQYSIELGYCHHETSCFDIRGI